MHDGGGNLLLVLEMNLAALQASRRQQRQKEVACMSEGNHCICFLIDGSVTLGYSCRKCLGNIWSEKTPVGSSCLVFISSMSEFQACSSTRKWPWRALENLKEWILHGFEIGIRAQEWKTCQAATSGHADHVQTLLFYLLLLGTFSPHEQDCVTRGGGQDQVLPF